MFSSYNPPFIGQELPRWQSFDRHGGETRPAAAGASGTGGQPISVVKKPER